MFDFSEDRTVAEFSILKYLKSVHFCNSLMLLLLKEKVVSYYINYVAAVTM